MSKIIITWERETDRINFDFEDITHVDAQAVLLAVVSENHKFMLEELTHDHIQSHGDSDGGGGERGDDQQPSGGA